MIFRTIWKYPVPIQDEFTLAIPDGAEVLTVQMQGEQPAIWALVNPDNPMAAYRFRLAGTGHVLTAEGLRYIGSFQMTSGRLIFHLFLLVEEE